MATLPKFHSYKTKMCFPPVEKRTQGHCISWFTVFKCDSVTTEQKRAGGTQVGGCYRPRLPLPSRTWPHQGLLGKEVKLCAQVTEEAALVTSAEVYNSLP